jgi:uncharacterized membrane protein
MPTWLAIVLIAIVVLLALFVAGGVIAVRRREVGRGGAVLRDIALANEALAHARAQDRGWDRDVIDAAARAAHLSTRPDALIEAVHLIQVVDRPGTDDDEARVRVIDASGQHEILLGRRGGEWRPTGADGGAHAGARS